MESDFVETIEGSTKLLVPKDSLTEKSPPRDPVFFNPRARISRDFSIIAYSTFLKNFKGPKIFLDSLAGIGARSIRVANEVNQIDKVFLNDINPKALEIAKEIAKINNVTKCDFSENEACRFLSLHSKREHRGAIVDIDPFGSPSKYLDCGIRATSHGGLLSVTATDLTVLHGLFPAACKRKYFGIPIRTEYGNEIALRLIIGCINLIAGRLDVKIVPLFAQNNMHYYKVYAKILVRTSSDGGMGYVLHCKNCGNREVLKELNYTCKICNLKAEIGGPLWIDDLLDRDFVNDMLNEEKNFQVDKSCRKTLEKSKNEIGMPPLFFTIDEIAHRMNAAPISLAKTIEKIQRAGFKASATSFNPSAFKTDAKIDDILSIV